MINQLNLLLSKAEILSLSKIYFWISNRSLWKLIFGSHMQRDLNVLDSAVLSVHKNSSTKSRMQLLAQAIFTRGLLGLFKNLRIFDKIQKRVYYTNNTVFQTKQYKKQRLQCPGKTVVMFKSRKWYTTYLYVKSLIITTSIFNRFFSKLTTEEKFIKNTEHIAKEWVTVSANLSTKFMHEFLSILVRIRKKSIVFTLNKHLGSCFYVETFCN